MTSLADLIRNHLAYNIWATGRLLDATEQLSAEQREHDFGSADKSVKGTLVHLYRSERTWLGRIERGNGPVPWAAPDDDEQASLRAKWAIVQHGWTDWASRLTEEDATRILDYTDLKGNPWSQPIWQIVLHVVNHGTHHRGQVSGFLRASGTVPPPLDFIAFMRLQQPK